MLAKYLEASGLTKKICPRWLRPTFARHKSGRDVSPYPLREWLGSARLDTTQIAVQLSQKSSEKVMEAPSRRDCIGSYRLLIRSADLISISATFRFCLRPSSPFNDQWQHIANELPERCVLVSMPWQEKQRRIVGCVASYLRSYRKPVAAVDRAQRALRQGREEFVPTAGRSGSGRSPYRR